MQKAVTNFSPIVRAFYRMDETVEKQMNIKIDAAYPIAKEGMALTKMKSLCQLQECHGIRLGIIKHVLILQGTL